MSKHLDDLIKYRLERSKETIEEAKLLAKAGSWNTCINRLYYSCFYALSALLVKHGLSSSKHTGVRSFFNKEFIKKGKLPKKLAILFNDLFEKRQEGDYLDFVYFLEGEVLPYIPQAEDFIKQIEKSINEK